MLQEIVENPNLDSRNRRSATRYPAYQADITSSAAVESGPRALEKPGYLLGR